MCGSEGEREKGTVEVSGSLDRSKLLTSFLGNPVRILYSEGKYSFAPKKFIKSLAAAAVAAAVGGEGGDEMKSCSDLWGGGGLSLPSIYVWLETSAVQWCHLGTGSALCKVSLHSPPQARGEHCLPSIVASPIVRVATVEPRLTDTPE